MKKRESSMRTLLVLRHDEMLPFVRRYYFAEISWVSMSHQLFTLLFLGLCVRTGIDAGLVLWEWLGRIGWAVVAFMVLVPVHEGIHGLMYLMLGAKDIRFRISFRNAYAYALAHRHVVNVREFIWVAIAPFLLITAFLAGAIALFPAENFLVLAVLVLHTAGCSGDWAMLNYLWHNRTIEMYSFDDADEHATFFVTRDDEA